MDTDDEVEVVSPSSVIIPIEQLILEYFIRDGRKYKDMVNLSKMRADFSDRKKYSIKPSIIWKIKIVGIKWR